MAYRGTVFTEDFVDDLRRFVDPITDALRRVDNKDVTNYAVTIMVYY